MKVVLVMLANDRCKENQIKLANQSQKYRYRSSYLLGLGRF